MGTSLRSTVPAVVLLAVIALFIVVVSRRSARPADEPTPKPTAEQAAIPPHWEQLLPGQPPAGDPQFEVQTELRYEGPRPVLYFYVREVHGWQVDMIYLEFWHRSRNPATGEWERDEEPVTVLVPDRLPFGETLTFATTLIQVNDFPGHADPGGTENWVARVYRYLQDRVRAPPGE